MEIYLIFCSSMRVWMGGGGGGGSGIHYSFKNLAHYSSH